MFGISIEARLMLHCDKLCGFYLDGFLSFHNGNGMMEDDRIHVS